MLGPSESAPVGRFVAAVDSFVAAAGATAAAASVANPRRKEIVEPEGLTLPEATRRLSVNVGTVVTHCASVC